MRHIAREITISRMNTYRSHRASTCYLEADEMGRTNSNKTILLVDDEASFRELIRPVLEHAGYRVREASSFEEAVKVSRRRAIKIDLLLTDVSMPGRNGYELAAQLAESQPGLKVIFMSGQAGIEAFKFYATPESEVRLLTKPFEMRELLDRVDRALNSKGWQMGHAGA